MNSYKRNYHFTYKSRSDIPVKKEVYQTFDDMEIYFWLCISARDWELVKTVVLSDGYVYN